MHLNSLGILLSLFLTYTASQVGGVSLSYDTIYDQGDTPITAVACSAQLEARGYQTFGSLPDFPYIGGIPSSCGTCWQLTYAPSGTNQTSIHLLAIDNTRDFVTGVKAMNNLTNSQAVKLGRINVTAKKVDPSKCGFH